MPLRVCTLLEYPVLNGGERSWLAAVPFLQQAGLEVMALAPPEGAVAQALRQAGVAHRPWTIAESGRRLPPHVLRPRLAAELVAARPDIVHANSLSTARLAGPVTHEMQLPCLGHLRDIIRLSRQAICDLNTCTRLVAVSQAVRDFHGRQGLAEDRVVVRYNGVDLEQFAPRPPSGFLRVELSLDPSWQLVGGVGQIGLRKGWDVLLVAFRRVLAARPKTALIIVGARNSQKEEARQYEQELLRAASDGPLRGHVFFLGRREDVPQLFTEWTMLVHPARQEPLGRVLLEAAASGLPVVATDVGGTREIFPSAPPAAQLVPPDDPAALADAVLDMLGDTPQRIRLAEAARQRAERCFAAPAAGSQLATLLQTVAASHTG